MMLVNIQGSDRLVRVGLLMATCCAILSFLSCGGGGGTTGGVVIHNGIFVDSPVEGLDYQTGSASGRTGTGGQFDYRDGEMITFAIGDVVLGQAAAKGMLTPIDLVPGPADETHPMVTNICRLLQSLDVDGDPQNGIVITAQIRAEVDGRAIDVDVTITEFENDPAVETLFDTLNALNLFTANIPRQLIDAATAQGHLRATLADPDQDGDGYTAQQGDCDDSHSGIHPGAVDICGDGIDQDCSNGDLPCSPSNSAYETELLDLISDYRASNARPSISFDALLNSLATDHSEYMAANDSMSHDGFYDRAANSGFTYCVENVGWNYATPQAQFDGWRNSSGHNQNMLNVQIEFAGISKVGPYVTFFACGN